MSAAVFATSAASGHARLARRLWDATSEGDADALLGLYAPDVVWRSYGSNPLSREVKGSRAVLDELARFGEGVDDLSSALLDIFASERGAVIHYRVTARRGPKRLETEAVMLLRIEGGRVTRVCVIPGDQERNDRFWRVE